MDPQLQAAIQMLQEAQQVLAMQSEEIQALRQQVKKPGDSKQGQQGQPIQKQSSEQDMHKIASIVGMREEELPSFLKLASVDEARDFVETMEIRARHTSIGKIAEIYDGSQASTPEEMLEAALSGLI